MYFAHFSLLARWILPTEADISTPLLPQSCSLTEVEPALQERPPSPGKASPESRSPVAAPATTPLPSSASMEDLLPDLESDSRTLRRRASFLKRRRRME